jgi:hypothetical protein
MTDSTIEGRAQAIADELVRRYRGDRSQAEGHALGDARHARTPEERELSFTVLALLRPSDTEFTAGGPETMTTSHPTTADIQARAQELVTALLQSCKGDRARALAHAQAAAVFVDSDEMRRLHAAVLALLEPPADAFPGPEVDQFIRYAIDILDPGPVTIKPENRSAILQSILHLIRGAETRGSAARDEVAALSKFKSFVHRRLDEYQVPSDPVPEETATHGCRISGRLQWLNERRMTLEHAEVITRFLVAPPAGAGLNALRDALVALQRCAEILP